MSQPGCYPGATPVKEPASAIKGRRPTETSMRRTVATITVAVGGHHGNRTRHNRIASAVRPLGTWAPMVESAGIEPASMACDASVVPLDYDPELQWTDRESNPDLRTASAPSSRWTISPLLVGISNFGAVAPLPEDMAVPVGIEPDLTP